AERGRAHCGSLSFDKVRNDQAVGFRYLESDNGTYQTGVEIWQQPDLPSDQNLSIQPRLSLAKRRNDAAELLMYDVKGRPRIRMQVAPDGTPKLEFLDEAGKVTYSLASS